MTEIAVMLLAAGSSRRFGDDKRKHRLASGATMLEASIASAAAAVARVLVVLRHDDRDFARQLQNRAGADGISFYPAPDSASGMAHSIVNGMAQLRDCRAVMISLADLPFIHPATYRQIIAAYADSKQSGPIVYPVFAGKRGHPVLFDRRYFPEILALTGDQGAKSIIDRHPRAQIGIVVDDAGVCRDIDKPADA